MNKRGNFNKIISKKINELRYKNRILLNEGKRKEYQRNCLILYGIAFVWQKMELYEL